MSCFSLFMRFLCAILFISCAPSITVQASDLDAQQSGAYPDEWWAPVPRDQAKSWEILPQDAGPGEVILSKRTSLGILSNFAPTPIELDGVRYASVEGFWQMMKFPENDDDPRMNAPGVIWPMTRGEVGQLTAFAAKDAGTFGSKVMKQMGINWVTYRGKQMTYKTAEKGDHFALIVRATRAKVSQNPEVRRILLQTGDLVLKPDHHQEPDASPAWKYYEILMTIRGEIRTDNPPGSK